MSHEIVKCRNCKAPIIWAITERGKRIPLDAVPTMKGNMTLEADDVAAGLGVPFMPPRARSISPLLTPGQDRYMPHFSTCPEAKGWRR